MTPELHTSIFYPLAVRRGVLCALEIIAVPMTPYLRSMLLLSVIVFPSLAWGQTAVDPDPEGVLRKVIPDKLIVLTFDDAPASHATVVAPILKSLGSGGSIYVCNFDSFKTRKDWYLT